MYVLHQILASSGGQQTGGPYAWTDFLSDASVGAGARWRVGKRAEVRASGGLVLDGYRMHDGTVTMIVEEVRAVPEFSGGMDGGGFLGGVYDVQASPRVRLAGQLRAVLSRPIGRRIPDLGVETNAWWLEEGVEAQYGAEAGDPYVAWVPTLQYVDVKVLPNVQLLWDPFGEPTGLALRAEVDAGLGWRRAGDARLLEMFGDDLGAEQFGKVPRWEGLASPLLVSPGVSGRFGSAP